MRLCIPAVLLLTASALAQTKPTTFNEREIEPQIHAFDKTDVWTLHFRFKDPRILVVDVPGRGKRIVWYMWYQVVNNTGEPRIFIPDFELKTHDYDTIHADEVMPFVQEQIAKYEDPTGRLDIKNSVTISKEPIPLSKKDAFPRAVTGVAIWTDVYDRAPKTNRFSVFIAGLSDGWKEDPNTKVIRRKTLQLNFKRLGDDANDSTAIRLDPEKASEWIYRATDAKLKGPSEPKVELPMKNEPKPVVVIERIPDDLPKP